MLERNIWIITAVAASNKVGCVCLQVKTRPTFYIQEETIFRRQPLYPVKRGVESPASIAAFHSGPYHHQLTGLFNIIFVCSVHNTVCICTIRVDCIYIENVRAEKHCRKICQIEKWFARTHTHSCHTCAPNWMGFIHSMCMDESFELDLQQRHGPSLRSDAIRASNACEIGKVSDRCRKFRRPASATGQRPKRAKTMSIFAHEK